MVFDPRTKSVGRFKPVGTDCDAPMYYVASWKGMEFYVDTSSDTFGRRGDVYEYPLSDDIGYVDLGRKARRFKLEGYLLGSNQLQDAERIVREAESGGTGTLVHPLYGENNVACVELTTTADYRRDIKRTKLSFEFVEANTSGVQNIMAALSSIFESGNGAIGASQATAAWDPSSLGSMDTLNMLSQGLGAQMMYDINPNDSISYDAVDMLQRWGTTPSQPFPALP